jgi:hypothetical protein
MMNVQILVTDTPLRFHRARTTELNFFNHVTLCVLCHEMLSGMDLYGKEFP